jgi:hypothetical protein
VTAPGRQHTRKANQSAERRSYRFRLNANECDRSSNAAQCAAFAAALGARRSLRACSDGYDGSLGFPRYARARMRAHKGLTERRVRPVRRTEAPAKPVTDRGPVERVPLRLALAAGKGKVWFAKCCAWAGFRPEAVGRVESSGLRGAGTARSGGVDKIAFFFHPG